MKENKDQVKTEDITNDIKYKIHVPYNNPTMLQEKKKQKIRFGIVFLVCAIPFIIMAIAAGVSSASAGIVLAFLAFVVVCILGAVISFCTMKPSKSDDQKSNTYTFHEQYLEVKQENFAKNTNKILKQCLYRSYKNKQYVSKVIEYPNKFYIKIFTGTYNGAPLYDRYFIPTDVLKVEEIESFKEFLKLNLGNSYVVKKKVV